MDKDKRFKGVFFCVLDDGRVTDRGIVDEMLEDEQVITEQLVRAGIIKQRFVVCDKEPE